MLAPALATDVFLVASCHETDVCGCPQYQAAMDALKQGGFSSLSSKGYCLVTRVRSKEDVAKDIEQVKKDIGAAKPKLVLTGLHRSLDDYNQKARILKNRAPSANITGIFEYIIKREQFDMLEAVLDRPMKMPS